MNLTPLFRHAVEAADVAAIGDADAQIVVDAAEGVRYRGDRFSDSGEGNQRKDPLVRY